MIKTMSVRNFTVFPKADLIFSPTLNVIVGENGAGKTHLLKMAYCVLAATYQESRKPKAAPATKASLQIALASKLVNVFRPESLGRLARRRRGRERCDISVGFAKKSKNISFDFATNSRSEVNLTALPAAWIEKEPTYLPTRELLSIFPNFVSFYDGHYLEFEETWRDTCVLLGKPLQRGPKEQKVRSFLGPLEKAMDGYIELDNKTGRFYLNTASGRMEVPLVAEGLRKLGMLTRLIANGSLLDQGYLFWDEPEANLNPKLIKQVAQSIVQLSLHGIQVFIATHSLFLLRELEILLQDKGKTARPRFFGLVHGEDGIDVLQGDSVDDIGDISSLSEELKQSDRFLQVAD